MNIPTEACSALGIKIPFSLSIVAHVWAIAAVCRIFWGPRNDFVPQLAFRALLLQVSLDESDEQDGTPLHYAAKKGFVGLAKVLVGAGATVDVRNAKNMAPLHLVRKRTALPATPLSAKNVPCSQLRIYVSSVLRISVSSVRI